MIKLLLKTTIRNLRKDRFHLTLNITGLAIGLAAFLYLASYVFYELSFDRFHQNADRIYRCVAFTKLGNNENSFARSEFPLAAAAKDELPEIEEATRMLPLKNIIVKKDKQKTLEDEIWYADPNVLNVFDFSLLSGSKESFLSKPYSIALTKETAKRYFGEENPIGKSLVIGDKNKVYQVTGILNNLPSNSHLQFNMLASISSISENHWGDKWGDFTALYTYVLVKEGTNYAKFNEKFQHFPDKYWEPMMKSVTGKSLAEFRNSGNYLRYHLQPLSKIHLDSSFSEELKNQGNAKMLLTLSITGIFILIIAAFNFLNLSTARATLKGKEIGIKKIVGSSRVRLIFQILFETTIHTLIALSVSMAILFMVIPFLNNYFEIVFEVSNLFNGFMLITLCLLPIVITFLAGLYPSFYISRYKPEEILSTKFITGKSKSALRNGLVSVQFAVFIILIFSSIIIGKQIQHLHQQNPGFDKENVLVIKNISKLKNSASVLKATLLKNNGVTDASFTSAIPSVYDDNANIFSEKGKNEQIIMKRLFVDADFKKTFKTEMLDGRWFFDDNPDSEKGNAIINEEAAKRLRWTDSSNKTLFDYNFGGNDFNVVGIVKDFHLQSMKEKPQPMVIRIKENGDFLAVRTSAGQAQNIHGLAKNHWEELNSETPFEYFFLDQNFDAQYKSEEKLIRLISVFTIIAILIACVGLFGLISFSSLQRQKEIGVRKVNGAKVGEIMAMLNKDLIKWVVISFIVAAPISWYAMQKWLENYAHKTTISWWVFALAGALAFCIALLTVSFQSYKAATRNPVEALRYE